ncbi:TonB family protein [Thalassotalea piscium]
MNDEQFDKELNHLYQARKAQLVPPAISFEDGKKKTKFSIMKILSIATVGGLASFGIMALVIQLIEQPINKDVTTPSYRQVEIAELDVAPPAGITPLKRVELPPKPEVATLSVDKKLVKSLDSNISVDNVEKVEIDMIQTVTLPQVKAPKLSIQPIFKVMPSYPTKALLAKQSGSIKLSYEIDNQGEVKNINVVESDVSRALQRAAKKALAKWKYKAEDNVQRNYQIVFEFNAVNQ